MVTSHLWVINFEPTHIFYRIWVTK